jgi:hypothetical protein
MGHRLRQLLLVELALGTEARRTVKLLIPGAVFIGLILQ